MNRNTFSSKYVNGAQCNRCSCAREAHAGKSQRCPSPMKQIDATAKADHGRKVHVHGYPYRRGNVAIVVQLGFDETDRPRGSGDGIPAFMTRTEARKLHRALGRILTAKAGA